MAFSPLNAYDVRLLCRKKGYPRAYNSYDTDVVAKAYLIPPFLLVTKSSRPSGGGGSERKKAVSYDVDVWVSIHLRSGGFWLGAPKRQSNDGLSSMQK